MTLEIAQTREEKGNVLQSQQVVEHWIRLYNRLIGASYRVAAWPCADSSETSVYAVCTDNGGHLIALEHTLVGIQYGEAHAWRSINGSALPGTGVIGSTLEPKRLKLSAANADKRILLLEAIRLQARLTMNTHVSETRRVSGVCEVASMKSGESLRPSWRAKT
jgi:hypothetical protein